MTPSPVQSENGHSRIAHPIMEALARVAFTNAEFRIVHVVIRETYGWSRRDVPLSYTRLERLTGLPRKTVARGVRLLLAEGVLLCTRMATHTEPATYRLQKDPRKWGRYAVSMPALGVVMAGDTLAGDTLQGDTLGGDSGVVTQGDSPVDTQGDTLAPQSVGSAGVVTPLKQFKAKKAIAVDAVFDEAWALYPRRMGGNSKSAALRAWRASAKRGANPADMLEGVKRYRAFVEAAGSLGTQYVKQAATFFGPDEHWRDEWQAGPVAGPSLSRVVVND